MSIESEIERDHLFAMSVDIAELVVSRGYQILFSQSALCLKIAGWNITEVSR